MIAPHVTDEGPIVHRETAERALLHFMRGDEGEYVGEQARLRRHDAAYAGNNPQRQEADLPHALPASVRDNSGMPMNLVALLDRIDERLQALGLTDRKASLDATGKPDTIRNIRRGSEPGAVKLRALADALKTSTEYLLGKADVSTPAGGMGERVVPQLLEMPRDIPVYGSAIGADIEFMSSLDESQVAIEQTDLDQSEVIDRFRRPPGLHERRDLYGLYVAGSSMEPAFESGRGILIDPKRPPAMRDYVVVYMARRGHQHADLDGVASVLIKRLVRKSASYVELEQFNPPATFRIATKDIAKMDRVMPWDEAFGM